MAITKIKPVKTRNALKNAVEYILDPDKTDGKMLASSFGCSYETAYEEFSHTLSQAMEKGNNRAHHLIQAFEPGETTPEQAHEIGKRLADEITKGRYEYVLTTHIDKGHIHNHILFCAASYVDHKKYVSNRKSYSEIRSCSDRLCKEYGLSIVKPGHNRGKSYAEYAADRDGGGSWKGKLRVAIDNIIPQSKDFEDFLRRLEVAGYDIKRGKYISVRAPGQERFTRTKTLGIDYAEDAIIKRIAGDYIPTVDKYRRVHEFVFDESVTSGEGSDLLDTVLPAEIKPYIRPPRTVNLIVDLQNCIKAQQSAGYARWQKIQNLKEAAKTLNFLTDNNLLQYSVLNIRVAEVSVAFNETADTLKATEKRLLDMGRLIKHIEDYQQTKPIYDGLKTVKNIVEYRRTHDSDIIKYEAVAKALRRHADADMKLPNLAKLRLDHAKLTEKKNALRSEYGKLKRQVRDYSVVQKNVISILDPMPEQQKRDKARGAEL